MCKTSLSSIDKALETIKPVPFPSDQDQCPNSASKLNKNKENLRNSLSDHTANIFNGKELTKLADA